MGKLDRRQSRITEPEEPRRGEDSGDDAERWAHEIPLDARKILLDDFLFFSIAGMPFCVRLMQIVSIVNVDDALVDMDFGFTLPTICKGFVKYRRKQVPLLDLRPKFGFTREAAPERAIGLAVDFGVSFLALLVDYVQSPEKGSEGYLLPLPMDISSLGNQFLSGYVEHPRGGAFLIDMMNILTDSDIEELAEVIL